MYSISNIITENERTCSFHGECMENERSSMVFTAPQNYFLQFERTCTERAQSPGGTHWSGHTLERGQKAGDEGVK